MLVARISRLQRDADITSEGSPLPVLEEPSHMSWTWSLQPSQALTKLDLVPMILGS